MRACLAYITPARSRSWMLRRPEHLAGFVHHQQAVDLVLLEEVHGLRGQRAGRDGLRFAVITSLIGVRCTSMPRSSTGAGRRR